MKLYPIGMVNTDLHPSLLPAGAVTNRENLRVGSTDRGQTGYNESVVGNELLYAPPNPNERTDLRTLGTVSDESGRYLVWFTHAPATEVWGQEDTVFLLDRASGSIYPVLNNTASELDLSRARLVEGAIIGGVLYWVDGAEPHAVHLGAAITRMGSVPPAGLTPPFTYPANHFIKRAELALVRRPFPLPPLFTKETNAAYLLNAVKDESFSFAVECFYYTGGRAVLSPWSKASKLNGPTETYNYLRVSLPTAGVIPHEVRLVRLVVRYGSTARAFVVKTWDRRRSADAAAISAHNLGTPLTYDFYANTQGEALGDAVVGTSFHAVPLAVETLSVVRNRLLLARYTEGYDTPATTSLALAALSATPGGAIDTALYRIDAEEVDPDGLRATNYISGYYVQLTTVSPAGWYFLEGSQRMSTAGYPALDPAPASAAMADLVFRGATLKDVGDYLSTTRPSPVTISGSTTANAAFQVTGVPSSTTPQWKSRSEYQVGTVFYDEALRHCGVITHDGLVVHTTERNFAGDSVTSAFRWTLSAHSGDDAARRAEIPEWAHYYQVVRTLNLRTRYFIQSVATVLNYASRAADGTYALGSTLWDNTVVALALDTTPLEQHQMGYVFQAGDMCVLTTNEATNKTYELPVVGQEGKWLLLDAKNIAADLATLKVVYEVYTPYRRAETELFFEVGEMHPIEEAGTPERRYSALEGQLSGDTFLQQRAFAGVDYRCEAMCPNDKFFQRWDSDAGRAAVVTGEGQVEAPTGLRWSNRYIAGTDVNGLPVFEALNYEHLPLELGAVQRLQLTAKAQSEGTVLLAIGRKQTCSLYLGEAQLSDAAGSTFLVKTQGFIGQVNTLEGSHGTLHPESVAAGEGIVFFLDALSGQWVQYSRAGLEPVSRYGFSRDMRRLCERLLETPALRVPSVVDPVHAECWLAAPQTEAAPPAGNLPGESGVVNRCSFYDGEAKVWVYKIDANGLLGSFRLTPEWLCTLGAEVYAFYRGQLWRHGGTAPYGQFFYQDTTPRLAVVANGEPSSEVKVFAGLSVESNATPLQVHVLTEREHEGFTQYSDIVAEEFRVKEGVDYAPIRRNRLTPGAGSELQKLVSGEELRGVYARLWLEYPAAALRREIRFVGVIYTPSIGHKL